MPKVFILLVMTSTLFVFADQSIQISTVPAGAKIILNGADTGLTTPAAVGPINSSSSVVLKKECFEDVRWSGDDEDAETLPSNLTLSLTPLPGGSCGPAAPTPQGSGPRSVKALQVNSNPEGGLIFVNGRSTGMETPALLNGIPENSEIKIKKSGFLDCVLTAGTSENMTCQLRRRKKK